MLLDERDDCCNQQYPDQRADELPQQDPPPRGGSREAQREPAKWATASLPEGLWIVPDSRRIIEVSTTRAHGRGDGAMLPAPGFPAADQGEADSNAAVG